MGIKAFAPASVGNIGIGFDILGLAIEKPGDEVIARKSDTPGLRITKITGAGGKLPYEPERNTAGVAVLRLLQHLTCTGVRPDHEAVPACQDFRIQEGPFAFGSQFEELLFDRF
jgi:homoserine kinase